LATRCATFCRFVTVVSSFFGPGTDLISLLILLLFLLLLLLFFFLERPLQKSLRLRYFKSDRDEICLDSSITKHSSIDGVGFLM